MSRIIKLEISESDRGYTGNISITYEGEKNIKHIKKKTYLEGDLLQIGDMLIEFGGEIKILEVGEKDGTK